MATGLDGSYILEQLPSALPAPDACTPTLSPPTSPTLPTKTRRSRIEHAISTSDVGQLRSLASEPGGFFSRELRRGAWPVLLGVAQVQRPRARPSEDGEDGVDVPHPHKDEHQVRLDVNRSFVNYPNSISADEKEALRVLLDDLIVTVLRRHPSLHYFQGYHDIVSVFQLNLEDQELSLALAERMSLHRLRDYMGTGLEPVLGYLRLVHRILQKEDAHLSEIVSLAAALPYFSLSWVLTLMSHDLTSLDVISRLFDFLLAHNPAMISYLGVAIVLLKKDELALLDDEDPAILHHTLSKLPSFAEPPSEGSLDPRPPSDEDLMSTSHPSPSGSESFLTDSVVSFSSDDRDTDTDSLSAMSDSMLSDPDISGLAHFDPLPAPSPPGSPPRRPAAPISIDELIVRALELYAQYPLVGPQGIAADEVLGPKSCVFTWELSAEGRLDDAQAEAIASAGVDIVLPEKKDEPEEETEEEEHTSVVEKLQGETRRQRRRRSTRRVELGVGTVLTLVGVAGVLLAIYGGDLNGRSIKEWRLRGVSLGLDLNWS